MPEAWIVPSILLALTAFLIAVWLPVLREIRRDRRR